MDFRLPDDVEQLRLAIRAFVDEQVIPREAEIERDNAVPDDVIKGAAELGLFGATIPE
jgi:acyl-CoA dehydrogenase